MNFDFPDDPATWSLAEKGVGEQNDAAELGRAPRLGDMLTLRPCDGAPRWALNHTTRNTSAGAPATLRLRAQPHLCVDSATLSTQCTAKRQCGAVLWGCEAAPPAAHTWAHAPDGTLRNTRDAGFVGANGGAESGGEHCIKAASGVGFPELDHCKAGAAELRWELRGDGTIASASGGGRCLGTAPPRAVTGLDQYMVGDSMMAAPVLAAGARGRRVYFPRGASWTHHFTGAAYAGGTTALVPAPLDIFPLFRRSRAA